MKTTITERGQVSIPAQLRREMQLEAGQTVVWEKVSATECRLLILPPKRDLPNPIAALSFARQHGLDEDSSDDYLLSLRAGEDLWGVGGHPEPMQQTEGETSLVHQPLSSSNGGQSPPSPVPSN